MRPSESPAIGSGATETLSAEIRELRERQQKEKVHWHSTGIRTSLQAAMRSLQYTALQF
jgi:hypothetical protein